VLPRVVLGRRLATIFIASAVKNDEPRTTNLSPSEPLLELRGVSFAYGPVQALRDVTLRLELGTVGVVGNNGAGKSTLLKILLGLLRPTSGEGVVLGRPLGGGGRDLRGDVGYVPETTAVVPLLNGAEFAALSGELYGMPRRDAFRRAHETLDYVGLGEMRYRRLDEYSTGNLQRLKLAAALVHDPQLLLLDEPTNGLDPAGRAAMLRLIEDLIADTRKSVLLCTHLLGDVQRVCRQIVVMNRGTVARAGTIESLRQRTAARYFVSWQGDAARLPAACEREQIAVTRVNGFMSAVVDLPAGATTNRLFQLARENDATIVELRAEQEDLEQLFFRVTQTPEAAHAS
jgi:ABC-2 type transport system ATP-binding protein